MPRLTVWPGTYATNGDPACGVGNWDVQAPCHGSSCPAGKTRDAATFAPVKLNTSQWMDSITALGSTIAILTAKHGCGFTLWPTNATLPDGSSYSYHVQPRYGDVLRQFVDSADAYDVGYGNSTCLCQTCLPPLDRRLVSQSGWPWTQATPAVNRET